MPSPLSRRHRPGRPRLASFTLVEMLVVIAIISILAFLAIPSVMSLERSSDLTSGSNNLISQLSLSRDVAMARNCEVEFRFYELPDVSAPPNGPPTVFRAFQSFSLDENGLQTNAITKVVFLPDQVCMVNNNSVSTLLMTQNPPYAVAGSVGAAPLGYYAPGSYGYVAFHFKPDGSTDLNPNPTFSSWHLSLANLHDPAQAGLGLPANFVTIQIDPVSGRVRYFRPD
jgi:uncharacterized protein (TIGR02596 family)